MNDHNPPSDEEGGQPSGPGKRVLHVGCGPRNPASLHATFQSKAWQEIRLDLDPSVDPDIVADICDMAAVASASMDALWSSHNLEHLYAHQVIVALREFLRVLKPGGFALITLPDMQAVAAAVAQGNLEGTLYDAPSGPISAIDVIWGHRRYIADGNHFMAHKTGFTRQTLQQKLLQAGFEGGNIEREQFALWVVARKARMPSDGQ